MKKKKIFFSFLFIAFSLFLFSAPLIVSAQSASGSTTCSTCLPNPLGVNSVNALIGKVINAVLGVVGSLALLMFIYGGLTWMTSSGSADKVKKGKDILVWSILGMAVIFASYGLVNFVLGNLTS